ncbi:helix-turn-helix domain-containing protein [Paenibacillus sp. SAF-054]|uniref:helix-turn-helix domain-containing protein n=1 Tax=unclassified Paenibacillus TaxID=185978 RepID=UPI003F7FEDB1
MAKTQLEEMGHRLKSARIERKLTQVEVYGRTQISTDILFLYETAQAEPDLVTLSKLEDAYKVSLDWIITGFEFSSKSRLFAAEREVRRLQKVIEEQENVIETIQQLINATKRSQPRQRNWGS